MSSPNRPIAPEAVTPEQKSEWLTMAARESPSILSFRERALPLVGGYSFGNLVHADTIGATESVNRHKILDLIFQHLNSVGLYNTAQTLSKESGHDFQQARQPWEKTDLRLLVSLALGHRDDAWNLPPDPNHVYSFETIEEDLFSSPYREDTTTIWDEYFDPVVNSVFMPNHPPAFETIRFSSLKRMIVYLATANQNGISEEEERKFFLILHSITSSQHFLDHLLALFRMENAPSNLINESGTLELQTGVVMLIRRWIEYHGLSIGRSALNSIADFFRSLSDSKFSKDAEYILKMIPTLTYGIRQTSTIQSVPEPPIIPDPQAICQPNLSIFDSDPVETARQITLMEHEIFSSIHTSEFAIAFKERHPTINTPGISELFGFEDRLYLNFLAFFIEAEDRKRAFSRAFQIAEGLLKLSNYGALSSVVKFLLNEDVLLLGHPTTDQMQRVHTLNVDILVTNVERRLSDQPIIPNMRAEINSSPFEITKKADFVNGLINWERHREVAKRVFILYHFQNQRYHFYPIPQIRKVLEKAGEINMQAARTVLRKERLDAQKRSKKQKDGKDSACNDSSDD